MRRTRTTLWLVVFLAGCSGDLPKGKALEILKEKEFKGPPECKFSVDRESRQFYVWRGGPAASGPMQRRWYRDTSNYVKCATVLHDAKYAEEPRYMGLSVAYRPLAPAKIEDGEDTSTFYFPCGGWSDIKIESITTEGRRAKVQLSRVLTVEESIRKVIDGCSARVPKIGLEKLEYTFVRDDDGNWHLKS